MSATRVPRTLPELTGQVTTAQLPVTSAAGRTFVASAPTGLALASTVAAPASPAAGDLWVDPSASPALAGDGSQITGIAEAQVTNLVSDLAAKAPLASPAFTGTPSGAFRDKGGAAYNVRAYGATGDGTTDDTAGFNALLAAASGGGTLVVPPGSYLLSARISLRSKQRFLMDPAATLKAAPTLNGLALLYIGAGVTDVTIEGGTIDGQKGLNPTGTLFGIQIYSNCSRISIRNVHVQDVPADAGGGNFGDGIYIGTAAGSGLAPSDVLVEDCTVERATRNAVSVTAGQRVRVASNALRDCSGNTPGYAVDVEPNNAADPCTDIAIEGNTGTGNFGGVSVGGAGLVDRVTIDGNTFTGVGDNAPPSASNGSVGVNVGAGVTNLTIGPNVLANFTTAYVFGSPDVGVAGGVVSSCRYGLQVSANGTRVAGATFRNVWGEQTVKVQGHYLTLVNNRFYDCVDTARLAGLSPAVPAVAVVNVVDGWLHGTLMNNTVRDDRTTNAAATGVRLSSTLSDLNTWVVGPNQIHGVASHFSNGQGVFASGRQVNPASGPGTMLLGQAQGNLLPVNAASLELGNLTGMGAATGATASASTDVALDGSFSYKMVATATGSLAAFAGSSVVAGVVGETYTGTIYARMPAAAPNFRLQLYGVDSSGVELLLVNSSFAGAAGAWVKASVTATVPTTSLNGNLFMRWRWSPANVGDVAYFDCLSIAPGSGQAWQNAGQAVAEVGPTSWLVGGSTTSPQPFFLGSKGAAPINLNLLGGTGGTRFGDGNGNAVAAVDKNGSIATGRSATGSRPTVTARGTQWFDDTLGIPIWWSGADWRNAAGTVV